MFETLHKDTSSCSRTDNKQSGYSSRRVLVVCVFVVSYGRH